MSNTSNIKFFEHPEYQARSGSWQEYKDLYEGKHKILTNHKYLWPHEFELGASGTQLREVRENRTRYVNLIKSIVKRYISLIFKNEIDFSQIDKAIPEEERADIDGNGKSLQNFIMNEIARSYFTYGKAMVLVDAYSVGAVSNGEEKAVGHRPFMETLNPLEVKDWQIEGQIPGRKGKHNFIRCEYEMLLPRTSPMEEPKIGLFSKVLSVESGRYVQRLYFGGEVGNTSADSPDGWTQHGDEQLIDMPEIAVASIYDESWLEPLTPIGLLRHNTQSSLDNQLLFQAHQRVAVSGDFDENSDVVSNVGSWAVVPSDANIQVIEPSTPTSLEKRLETLTLDLFRVAFSQTRSLPADSKVGQSGDAMREAKEEFIATLESAGKDLEQLVNESIRHYAAFKSIKDFDGKVKFDLDITLEDVDQQILIAAAFASDIEKHPTWKRELLKKVATYQGLNKNQEIIKEIEQRQEAKPATPGGFLTQRLTKQADESEQEAEDTEAS